MPTQSTTYNTRLTDEALEKRFRDTFRSQGGAELVDDLYASGVIVPVVDFTAAAEGSSLRSDLQSAWDFGTGHQVFAGAVQSLITTPGFWKVQCSSTIAPTGGSSRRTRLYINDGTSDKVIYTFEVSLASVGAPVLAENAELTVFLRSGDTLFGVTTNADTTMSVNYRQIADVYGSLTQPTGYVSS